MTRKERLNIKRGASNIIPQKVMAKDHRFPHNQLAKVIVSTDIPYNPLIGDSMIKNYEKLQVVVKSEKTLKELTLKYEIRKTWEEQGIEGVYNMFLENKEAKEEKNIDEPLPVIIKDKPIAESESRDLLPENRISVKMIIENNFEKGLIFELFNKRNGLSFCSYPNELGKVTVQTTSEDKQYEQTYADFFESILEQTIVIQNIKSSDDQMLKVFYKTLLTGRQPLDFSDKTFIINGSKTFMNVILEAGGKFEINFQITGVENQLKSFTKSFSS